jgi:hypothetical protein
MSWPEGDSWLVFAVGVGYSGVALFTLLKFGSELLRPPTYASRRARLPFLLLVGRMLGGGGGFILFALTRSWIPLVCGSLILLSEFTTRRWTRRRLPDVLDSDPPS